MWETLKRIADALERIAVALERGREVETRVEAKQEVKPEVGDVFKDKNGLYKHDRLRDKRETKGGVM